LDPDQGNRYDSVIAPVDELFENVIKYGTVVQDAISNEVGGLGSSHPETPYRLPAL